MDVNGINKAAGESFHMLYSRVHRVRSTLRSGCLIGPCMRIKGNARHSWSLDPSHSGKPALRVWECEQLRDFTYVDDAVRIPCNGN